MTETTTEIVTEWTPEYDAANLVLLWLLIHGGDPLPEGDAGAILLSPSTYRIALDLVGALAEEFADTRVSDPGLVAQRMGARLNVDPVRPAQGGIQKAGSGGPICVKIASPDGGGHEVLACVAPPWLTNPLAL